MSEKLASFSWRRRPCPRYPASCIPHLASLLVVLLLSQVLQAADKAPPGPLIPKAHDGYDIKDDKILFRQGNAGLILEVADVEKIRKYYSDRGSDMGNPFPDLSPELTNATIFLLTFINHTKGNIVFTPAYVTLHIKEQGFFPLSFLLMLPMLDDVDKHTKKVIQDSVYHSPETVKAGEVITKFLIFPEMPKKKFESIMVNFTYLSVEDHDLDLKFYFERKKN